jgi:hypothetical protein
MAPWVFDPQSGGVKVPPKVQERTRQRILAYAEKHYTGKYNRLDIRFRGPFCYIDAYTEPDVPANWPPRGWPGKKQTRQERIEELRNVPLHLCRLRYFAEDRWSLAFYTYSHERYEPCVFDNGEWFGTPEEAFKIGAVYLD